MGKVLTNYEKWELARERERAEQHREARAWRKLFIQTEAAVALAQGRQPKPCGCGGRRR